MSQWTHVAGCIRVDAVRIINDPINDIKKVLGKIVRYGDSDWDTTIPCGSEGSLKYQIIENPDKNCMAAYCIPIWGDLRDYSNVEEIENWFNSCCENLIVRNAVLNIDVEFGIEKNISYKPHY